MIKATHTLRVGVPATAAFDVIATNVCENNPKWEAEVVEMRPLTPGPLGVGSRLLMVRQEFGRRNEVVCGVEEFDPPRRVKYSHLESKFEFHLTFDVAPMDEHSCEIRVGVSAQPPWPMRLLTPLLMLVFPRRTRRISERMAEVVEREASPGAALTTGAAV